MVLREGVSLQIIFPSPEPACAVAGGQAVHKRHVRPREEHPVIPHAGDGFVDDAEQVHTGTSFVSSNPLPPALELENLGR